MSVADVARGWCAAAPLVNSVSYGDVESSITLAYVQRVDLEFQKVGLTGTRHATSCRVTFLPFLRPLV